MTPAELLRTAPQVLLDFDGPVCAVYGGTSDRAVADHLRDLITAEGLDVPPEVQATRDPLDVLRHSVVLGAEALRLIEVEFTAQEVAAVSTATPTPGADEALDALVGAGHAITIVSNNSAEAVNAYLARANLGHLVAGVVGRAPFDPSLMKPHPHLLVRATMDRKVSPTQCLMIGDSASDIEAARAAAMPSIAFANRPAKRETLMPAHPDAIIDAMTELTAAADR